MAMANYWLLLLVSTCAFRILLAEKRMFDICDSNGDQRIVARELAVCLDVIPNPEHNEYESLNNKVNELMKIFDTNKDGSISVKEFNKATEKVEEAFELEEYIDVTMADGTSKKIHKSELFNNVKDSANGFEMRNEKIYKEENIDGNITELAKKDPALGNMIRIGQWAAKQLTLLNYTTGIMLNLESLPNGGSVVSKGRLDKEPELLGVKFNGPFEVWVKIKMGNPTAADPNITHFEVHLEYNKGKYRSPFLAVLNAWVVEPTGTGVSGRSADSADVNYVRVQPLEVPPPVLHERFSTYLVSQLKSYTSSPYAGLVIAVFVGLIGLSVYL